MTESTAFPWLKHLPEDDQKDFFGELSDSLDEIDRRTDPAVGVDPKVYLEVLEPLIAAWRTTAEVLADPVLYKALTEDARFDEGAFVLAHRPGEPCPGSPREEDEEQPENPDAFDAVRLPVSVEEAEKALKELYGGDWSKHIVLEPDGVDSVNTTTTEQDGGDHDRG